MFHSTCRRGFTRIEVVFNLAIIAILASLLFPIFAKARKNAVKANCVTNLHRIGVAWKQYTQDYDGTIMRFATSPDGAEQPSPTNKTTYWWGSWDKQVLKPEEGLLYPYLKTTQVYGCPSFPVTKAGSQGSMGYGYNADYLSPTTYSADYTLATPVAVSLSEVNQPARTVAFADAAQFASKRGEELRASTYLSPPRDNYPNFHGRHNGMGNVLFCDGHIKAIRPIYRQGTFGMNYSAAKFKKHHLGDLDEDGDLKTNEVFVLGEPKNK